MISAQSRTANRNYRSALALIALVVVGVLSGCGGAWQPDRPDQTRPAVKESGQGVYSPSTEDSRIQL